MTFKVWENTLYDSWEMQIDIIKNNIFFTYQFIEELFVENNINLLFEVNLILRAIKTLMHIFFELQFYQKFGYLIWNHSFKIHHRRPSTILTLFKWNVCSMILCPKLWLRPLKYICEACSWSHLTSHRTCHFYPPVWYGSFPCHCFSAKPHQLSLEKNIIASFLISLF